MAPNPAGNPLPDDAAARPTRRRRTWAIAAVAGIVVASAVVAVPAIADSGGGSPAHDHVVACESGVVDQGNGILTSSAFAARVPVGDTTPLPPECHEG